MHLRDGMSRNRMNVLREHFEATSLNTYTYMQTFLS